MVQVEKKYCTGGVGATPTETVYAADPTYWSYTGINLPEARAYGSFCKVGPTWYYYGGYDATMTAKSTIWSSNDLLTWNVSGNSLPTALGSARAIVTPNYVYLINPYYGECYRAPVADPTLVDPTPIPIAAGGPAITRAWPLFYICGGSLYMIGGYYGGVTYKSIYHTTLTNLEAKGPWTLSANVFPTNIAYPDNLGVIGDSIIMVAGTYDAGVHGMNTVYRASVGDPMVWKQSQTPLVDYDQDMTTIAAGPRLWSVGAYSSYRRYLFHSRAPWTMIYDGTPSTWEYGLRNVCFGYRDGYIYTVGGFYKGGGAPTNYIQRTTSRILGRAEIDPLVTKGRPMTLADGQPWAQSASERAGMISWFHHAYAP